MSRADVPAGPPAAVVVWPGDVNAVLAASTLAASLGGPLLLTGSEPAPGPTPTAIESELARLQPRRLILAGTNGTFSPAWLERFAQSANLATATVEVVGGADDCELSANIARTGGAATSEVALARVGDVAAMTQAVRSTAARAPLLLVSGPSLGSAASAFLSERGARTTAVTVFGGVDAIPDAALAGLPGLRRISGADPFQVAAAELYRGYSGRPARSLAPLVVDAADPIAQALAGVRSSRSGQPVILVFDQVLSPWTREWITNSRAALGCFAPIDGSGSLPVLVDWMLWKAACS